MFDTIQNEFAETEGHPVSLGSVSADLATQTIDLNSLFTPDVFSTGSFDLRSIESTSFGMLLDSLPIAALVIDQLNYIVFSNQACGKLYSSRERLKGRPFTDLLPAPRDAERAQALADKAIMLLERAFSTRKPQVAEAILEFDDRRIWCRLHLRTVRIGPSRNALLMIEDLTSEKTQQRLIEREQANLRREVTELAQRSARLSSKLGEARNKLEESAGQIGAVHAALRTAREKLEWMAHANGLGMATVGPDGSFEEINAEFEHMFGHNLESLPAVHRFFKEMASDLDGGDQETSCWLAAIDSDDNDKCNSLTVLMRGKGGARTTIEVRAVRLDNGDRLITFKQVSRECD